MDKRSLTERDICTKFILPAIKRAGWDEMLQVREEVYFTKGRIIVRGRLVARGKAKKADFVLYYKPNIPIALIEAKDNRHSVGDGLQQGLDYAATLDIPFVLSGVTKGKKVAANEAVDAPYLRVANVQRGYLDLSVVKKIAVRKADEERYSLRRGDVLMTEGGDWDKLGRAAIWREEIPGCIHQSHIFRVRPPSDDIAPEWVITYVNSLLGRAFFEHASKQTTNLASINMTQLRGCPFPLPPLGEQQRIVAKIDELMVLCDRLEASLTAAAGTRHRLLEAVLAGALAPAGDRELEAAE
jgi:type I restriction enzyme S subunit